MDYRHQFWKTARYEGEDPSIFAIPLETLAVKSFGDMGPNAQLRLIQDRSGGQVPGIGRNIPVHVAGMVGGEGGRQLHDDLATYHSSTATDPGMGVSRPDQ